MRNRRITAQRKFAAGVFVANGSTSPGKDGPVEAAPAPIPPREISVIQNNLTANALMDFVSFHNIHNHTATPVVVLERLQNNDAIQSRIQKQSNDVRPNTSSAAAVPQAFQNGTSAAHSLEHKTGGVKTRASLHSRIAKPQGKMRPRLKKILPSPCDIVTRSRSAKRILPSRNTTATTKRRAPRSITYDTEDETPLKFLKTRAQKRLEAQYPHSGAKKKSGPTGPQPKGKKSLPLKYRRSTIAKQSSKPFNAQQNKAREDKPASVGSSSSDELPPPNGPPAVGLESSRVPLVRINSPLDLLTGLYSENMTLATPVPEGMESASVITNVDSEAVAGPSHMLAAHKSSYYGDYAINQWIDTIQPPVPLSRMDECETPRPDCETPRPDCETPRPDCQTPRPDDCETRPGTRPDNTVKPLAKCPSLLFASLKAASQAPEHVKRSFCKSCNRCFFISKAGICYQMTHVDNSSTSSRQLCSSAAADVYNFDANNDFEEQQYQPVAMTPLIQNSPEEANVQLAANTSSIDLNMRGLKSTNPTVDTNCNEKKEPLEQLHVVDFLKPKSKPSGAPSVAGSNITQTTNRSVFRRVTRSAKRGIRPQPVKKVTKVRKKKPGPVPSTSQAQLAKLTKTPYVSVTRCTNLTTIVPVNSNAENKMMPPTFIPPMRTAKSKVGPSKVKAGPSGVRAGPYRVRAGPSGVRPGPSGVRAGPSGVRAGPSGVRAGPSGVRAGASGVRAGHSTANPGQFEAKGDTPVTISEMFAMQLLQTEPSYRPPPPPSVASDIPPVTNTKAVEAPVFHPTEEEFMDPIVFFETVQAQVLKFGICKVVAPKSFKPTCYLDDLQFRASNQYLGSLFNRWGPAARELAAIKAHLATQNVHFTKAPLYDGMEINLPQLYHVVQRLGGLNQVIEKKRWIRVAEDMHISKEANPEKALDRIYVKYLLPYDTLSPIERQQKLAAVEKSWIKRYERLLESALNPLRRQKRLLTDDHYASSDDDNSEDSREVWSAVSDAEDCVSYGRPMQIEAFKKLAKSASHLFFPDGEEHSLEDIEQKYWSLVLHGTDHACVYSASIDTTSGGHGFVRKGNDPCKSHPWNLKVLTNNCQNVLRCLGPVAGVTSPTLHLGMIFSTSCWHRDPHGLPWVEYMHSGASKIWYGIPDSQSANFRNAVERLCPTSCQNKSIWLPSDITMIPPQLLAEHGVSLSHVVQRPGEFVFVLPKAYSCSITTGYTVSESVYFATEPWLVTILSVFSELRDNCEPTMFSKDHFLINASREPRASQARLLKVHAALCAVLEAEMKQRESLYKYDVEVVTEEYKKRTRVTMELSECVVCRSSLYLSKVIGIPNRNSVLCLVHALEVATTKRYHGLKGSHTPVQLVLRLTDEQIKKLFVSLKYVDESSRLIK